MERTGGIGKGNSLRSPGHRRNRHHQPHAHHAEHSAAEQGAGVPSSKAAAVDDAAATAAATAPKIDREASPRAERSTLDHEDIYREIDNIIDSYLWRPDLSKPENEKRKAGAVASYFAEVPYDVEMRLKGFF